MSFNFGAPVTTTPTTSNVFRAAPTPAFGFGSPTTSAPAFGAATSVAPAFAATSANPGFGSPSATPGFGATSAAPGFGATSATTSSVAPAFSFGLSTTPQLAPTSAAPAPALGSNAGANVGALQFRAPSAPGTTAFGGTTTAGILPAFGATMTSSALPTFGATSTSGTLPAFGATTTTATLPAFGATLGTTTANPVPSLSLGGGGLLFEKSVNTTGATLNFGTNTTTTSLAPFSTSIAGGLFSKSQPSTSAATTNAPSTFLGLGGVDLSATHPKAGETKQDIKVRETQVPDEISKTMDVLKGYIKTQKTISSDIGRTSTTKFTNVSTEIASIQWALQEIANSVDNNNQQIKSLRAETSKTIQCLEMAQRTQGTPAGLQSENSAPFQYFQAMVIKYEQDLINFRQQIQLTERHMRELASPQSILPQDLKRGLKQLNEAFISIAGRLHELHQKVEEQKEQYLAIQKRRLRNPINVFAEIDNQQTQLRPDPQRLDYGPTPFSNIMALGLNLSSAVNTSNKETPTAK